MHTIYVEGNKIPNMTSSREGKWGLDSLGASILFKLFTTLMYYFHNLKIPTPWAHTRDSDSVGHVYFLNLPHAVLLYYHYWDPLGTLEGCGQKW